MGFISYRRRTRAQRALDNVRDAYQSSLAKKLAATATTGEPAGDPQALIASSDAQRSTVSDAGQDAQQLSVEP